MLSAPFGSLLFFGKKGVGDEMWMTNGVKSGKAEDGKPKCEPGKTMVLPEFRYVEGLQ